MYGLNASKESAKDAEITKLKRQVKELKEQLSRERERLAYAAMAARRKYIDPIRFEEESPLLVAIKKGKRMANG